jgi:hypothetical protein
MFAAAVFGQQPWTPSWANYSAAGRLSRVTNPDALRRAREAARVGYESHSQFNRDFKRFLGRSPGQEARCMKTLFSLLPPALLEALATKHDEVLTACMAVRGCP